MVFRLYNIHMLESLQFFYRVGYLLATRSKDQPVCASCRYWSGQRNIDFTASFFEAKEVTGRCNGPYSGSMSGLDTYEGASCLKWETVRTSWNGG